MPRRLKKADSRRVETHGGDAARNGKAASVFGPPLDMEMSEAGLWYWLG